MAKGPFRTLVGQEDPTKVLLLAEEEGRQCEENDTERHEDQGVEAGGVVGTEVGWVLAG
jgi:hypothetical protein